MFAKITLFLILGSLWLILSGFFKPLFFFFGTASVLICIYIYSKMSRVAGLDKDSRKPLYLSLKYINYLLWLSKEIIVSSVKLSFEIWKEKPSIKPETSWIDHDLNKEEGVTLYANSITLTPGTVSIYTSKKGILVHAIHKDNIKDLKSNRMHDKVKKALS